MSARSRPNVVFLLADNLGYGDVGCYGSGGETRGMPTPNIDRLADDDLLPNQFLVEAAAMTGRYSIRSGLSLVVIPDGTNELTANEFTLGDLFKNRGYETIYYGKWHLVESTESEPQYHDFDQWRYGFCGSSDGTLNGDNLVRYHVPLALQEEGVRYVREIACRKRESLVRQGLVNISLDLVDAPTWISMWMHPN